MKTRIISRKMLSANTGQFKSGALKLARTVITSTQKNAEAIKIRKTGKNKSGHAIPLPDIGRNHETESCSNHFKRLSW